MAESENKTIDLTQMPVCLISCGESGCEINIEEDTLKALAERDKPAVVVAIVGLYRTGKSYLMNQLAGRNRPQSGFQLGSTVQSKTKGIWIWVRPHPEHKDRDLILLDTEGLGDVDKTSREHDKYIYYLATLLSSVLVHNSMGAFNEKKVEDLSFVAKMKLDIKTRRDPQKGDDLGFNGHFPDLVIALRDFGLELEIDGKVVTADEYLEHSLTMKKGEDENTIKYNEPRMYIRKYFNNRKCFTFDRPGNRKVLQNIEVKTEEGGLDEEFVEVLQQFQKFVYKEGPIKKTPDGSHMNGRRLSEFLQSFVKNIKEEKPLCIEEAVKSMEVKENDRAVQRALQIFKGEMDLVEKPGAAETILGAKPEALAFALEDFKMNSLNDWDLQYHEELLMKCEAATVALFEEHLQASMRKCQEVLEMKYRPIATKWGEERYNPKGSTAYQNEVTQMIRKFKLRTDLGMKKSEVLQNFKTGKFSISTDRSVDTLAIERKNEGKQKGHEGKQENQEQEKEAQEELDKISKAALESMMISFKAFGEKKEKETQHIGLDYEEKMKMGEMELDRLKKEGKIEEARERKKEIDAQNRIHKDEMKNKENKLAEIKGEKRVGNVEEMRDSSISKNWFKKQLAFWKNLHKNPKAS